ncbi:hypothetical protein FVEN_g10954 [Fusarium venenatum]|nr:hypothetical protein FVEN_g10954 [Fusarium venenatum]
MASLSRVRKNLTLRSRPSVDFGERTRRKKYTGVSSISGTLTTLLLTLGTSRNRTTADTIGGIAARWELGSELTIAHVEPGHPDCPPGIDPETPGRVSLSSAREQEKVLEENMAMFQCEGVEEDEPDEQPEESTDVGGRKRKRTS